MHPIERKVILHAGCGNEPLPQLYATDEWREVRMDRGTHLNVDLPASPDSIPAADDSFDRVYCAHTLEHVPAHDVVPSLKELARVLKPGCILRVIVPDIAAVARLVAYYDLDSTLYHSPAGPVTIGDVLWGFADWIAHGKPLYAHRTGFSRRTLAKALQSAGLEKILVEEKITTFELNAFATKPIPPAEKEKILSCRSEE